MKPTWNAISREGQKIYSLIYDTLGLYARSIDDLDLLADVFALHDDTPVPDQFEIRGARFAICKTMVWNQAGPGTVAAMEKAKQLLEAEGAQVDEIEFPATMTDLPKWYNAVIALDGSTAFLPEYRTSREKLSDAMKSHAENRDDISHAEQLDGFDKIASARPVIDSQLRPYAATIVPSVPDEAPIGLESTGSAAFNGIWTVSYPILTLGLSMKCTNIM
jgi:NCS1 family nucleobase:cation symporter-1